MPTSPYFQPGRTPANRSAAMVGDASDHTRFVRLAAQAATTAVPQRTPGPKLVRGMTDNKSSTLVADIKFMSSIYGQYNSFAENRK
jgi:hypothetical protein